MSPAGERGSVRGRLLLAFLLVALALWVNRGALRRLVHGAPPTSSDLSKLEAALAGRSEGEALALIHEVVRAGPEDPFVIAFLMDALMGLGEHREVVELGRRALEGHGEYQGIRLRVGIALAEQGRREQAERELREVLRAVPGNHHAHAQLGRVLHHQGRLGEAMASYGRALELEEDFGEAHLLLGTARAEAGDLDGALASYRRAAELGHRRVEAVTNMGHVHLRREEPEEARRCFRRALELDPEATRARTALETLEAAGTAP